MIGLHKNMMSWVLLGFLLTSPFAKATPTSLICDELNQVVDPDSVPDSLVLPKGEIDFAEWTPEFAKKFEEVFPEDALRTAEESIKFNRRKIIKKWFEKAIVVVSLPLTIPTVIAAALIIRLSSRGPVFFMQNRIGYQGKPFRIFKLRTMKVPKDNAAGPLETEANDPRIVWGANIIRKLHIDELPQLINILSGDMALVGPRPHAVGVSEDLMANLPGYGLRFQAMPGLASDAQLLPYDGGDEEAKKVKLGMDLYYAKRISLRADILTLLKTLITVPFGHGAR